MSGNLMDDLCDKRIETTLARILLGRNELQFDSTIIDYIKLDFPKLQKFVDTCHKLYCEYENVDCLSKLPFLMPLVVQKCICIQIQPFLRGPSTHDDIESLLDKLVNLANIHGQKFEYFRLHLPLILEDKKILFTPRETPSFQLEELDALLFNLNPYHGQNIIQGSYNTFSEYLDIHFRLLKEDFTAQLRCEGTFKTLGFWKSKGQLDDFYYTLTPKTFDIAKIKVGSLFVISKSIYARVCGIKIRRNECMISLFSSSWKLKLEEIYEIEEFNVFFEPYYQVLRALHQMKSLGRFEKYLVFTSDKIDQYLLLLDKKVNFISVYSTKKSIHHPNICNCEDFYNLMLQKNVTTIPDRPLITLSEARNKLLKDISIISLTKLQVDALVNSISQEMTLIHGPPGTGKSYIAKIIIQTFLINKSVILSRKISSPILIVSYSNQALDKLLEEVLPFTSKILRIGHQSVSDKLTKLHEIHGYFKEKGLFPSEIYKYSRESNKIFPSILLENIHICSKVDIIGMTSTSLGKNFELVQILAPEVILVEEASEMFESHLITSLGKLTKYCILIGDHKQLRPKVATFDISIKNGLEVSLFERYILNHPEKCVQLNEQRRCCLELFKLISNVLYLDLKNHCSSNIKGHVLGCDSNIQVYNHSFREEGDLFSKCNSFEAEMSVALAEYLVRCGHREQEITILSAYKGQVDYLKRILQESSILRDIQIQTVDNFQGRENDIIILSLVRSEKETIGFLSISHRVTVALTRARRGLFLIGNINHLGEKSSIWNEVKSYSIQENIISNKFNLHCPNHKNETSFKISSSIDFKSASCSMICGFKYKNCDHTCKRSCELSHLWHEDDGLCTDPCSIKCKFGHVCSGGKCHGSFIPCPLCQKIVKELLLECGHILKVFCYRQEDEFFLNRCTSIVEESLPRCGHVIRRPCWNKNNFICEETCGKVLSCGHECELKCHLNSNHNICEKSCTKIYLDCNHTCNMKCYVNCPIICPKLVSKRLNCGHVIENVECGKKVFCTERCNRELICGHGNCKRFCYECQDSVLCDQSQCNEKIRVNLECGHTQTIKCSSAIKKCGSKCTRKLLCGHPCTRICSDPCDNTKCDALIETNTLSCGHVGLKKCKDQNKNIPCSELCQGINKICGHPCKNRTCSDCLSGEIHFPCQEPCERTLLCGHKCPEICGAPCPPCDSKCLITCSHLQKCRSKCDEPCQPDCKIKCGWSCSHGKCGFKCIGKKCRKCDNLISINQNGLKFTGRCTGIKTDDIKFSPKCTDPNNKNIYLMMPDCGHWIREDIFKGLLNSNIVGMLKCPECQLSIISWIHGYKKEMKLKNKDEIIGVQDIFFSLKTNLIKRKTSLLISLKESSFNEETKERLCHRLSNMSLSRTIATEIILNLLQFLDIHVKENNFELYTLLIQQLQNLKEMPIGKDYIVQFSHFLSCKGFPKLEINNFFSFDMNNWTVSGNKLENIVL